MDKEETSQPSSVNQIQNVHINQPKQLKQPKHETIHQNQPQQLNQEKTHQNQPQQLNQPIRETINHDQPPFSQGTQYQHMQHNQGSWITQKIQQNQYIQPNQPQLMNFYTNMPITTNQMYPYINLQSQMQSQAKTYDNFLINTAQPQFQCMNTAINNYTNSYHRIAHQPLWTNQQNQIQAQGFQTRNEYCLNNQYANSNYYSEHQIMDNLIREAPQYTNKSKPQSKKQEIFYRQHSLDVSRLQK